MPSKSNYICVECELEMRPLKNGVFAEEHCDYDKPYKIWHCDLWQCPKCGRQILAGFGLDPVAEHFDKEKYEKFLPLITHHIRETILSTILKI